MSKPVIYYYFMSAPSRAVKIFVDVTGIDAEVKTISILKGEHRGEAYLAVNKTGKIPYLQEADFALPEAGAILAYLADTQPGIPEHWYPKGARARARVNSALTWHGSTLRNGSVTLLSTHVLGPAMGAPAGEEVTDRHALPTLRAALKDLEDYWLAATDYVAGDRVSIADLLLATEVEELRLQDFGIKEPGYKTLLADHPKVRAWLARLAGELGSPYTTLHDALPVAGAEILKAIKDKNHTLDVEAIDSIV